MEQSAVFHQLLALLVRGSGRLLDEHPVGAHPQAVVDDSSERVDLCEGMQDGVADVLCLFGVGCPRQDAGGAGGLHHEVLQELPDPLGQLVPPLEVRHRLTLLGRHAEALHRPVHGHLAEGVDRHGHVELQTQHHIRHPQHQHTVGLVARNVGDAHVCAHPVDLRHALPAHGHDHLVANPPNAVDVDLLVVLALGCRPLAGLALLPAIPPAIHWLVGPTTIFGAGS
mmetsp:Transcript_33966/g.83942  ORF Transcript_33966/g.83942 Transcript_33966/m.83942 type:complete len:226 (-) Transcript_33966:79-756(-)